MRNFIKIISLILTSTLLIIGCKREKEYRVESEFDYFIQEFINEGSKRGKVYDFQKSGLIMEWGDSGEEGWAGLCHYENPIRIEIDREYWNSIKPYSNFKTLAEQLIFHELGHGFVNSRKHRNDLLPTGEWASLMAGADLKDYDNLERSFNINYLGKRKKYYLDELYIPTTSFPSWSYYEPNYSNINLLNNTYSDDYGIGYTNWVIGQSTYGTGEIIDGSYKYNNTSSHPVYQTIPKLPETDNNFYFKLKMRHTTLSPDDGFAILFAGNDNKDFYYLNFLNNGNLLFGNYMNFSWYVELTNVGILAGEFNTYEIRYFDNMFHLDINGKFVYASEHEGIKGNQVGFLNHSYTTIYVKEFEVASASNQAIALKTSPKVNIGKAEDMRLQILK
jgi:hypothetical protein